MALDVLKGGFTAADPEVVHPVRSARRPRIRTVVTRREAIACPAPPQAYLRTAGGAEGASVVDVGGNPFLSMRFSRLLIIAAAQIAKALETLADALKEVEGRKA